MSARAKYIEARRAHAVAAEALLALEKQVKAARVQADSAQKVMQDMQEAAWDEFVADAEKSA